MQSIFLALFGLVILMLGSGLLTTITPLIAEHASWSTYTIGLIAIANVAGLIAGSLHAKHLIVQFGFKRCYALLASLIAITTLLQGFVISPVSWLCMRFINGYCFAGVYIIIESWLLIVSQKESRNKLLGIYLISFYAATAGGSFLLHFIYPWDHSAFYIISSFSVIAIIPILFCQSVSINLAKNSYLSFYRLYQFSPLGIFGCFIAGAILSIFYSFGPLYGQQLNLTVNDIANFMGFTILGGMLGQLPIGKLADSYSRSKVLLFISSLTFIISILLIPSFAPTPLFLLYFVSLLFGIFSFTLYPVSMGYSVEHIPTDQYIAATGSLIFIYSIGSACGPLLSILFFKFTGHEGIFNLIALLSLTLCVSIAWNLTRINKRKEAGSL